MAVLSVTDLEFSIGERCLLNRVGFSIEKGERVCLLGRNGEGKSTLLNIIAGHQSADYGQVQWQSGAQYAFVSQQPEFNQQGSVYDAVAEGLGELAELVSQYHLVAQQSAAGPAQLAALQTLQQQLEAANGWLFQQRVERIISRLNLPADAQIDSLSGGWQRRVALGRALVREPDLLMLDEPTNHLDVNAIEWLEQFLNTYPGAVLFTTHDRSLLQRVATRIVELDRGSLTSWPGDYANYLRRQEERQNEEARHNERFDKKLAQEEVWIRQGIKARRTRNEGRVRALKTMRETRRARLTQTGTARMTLGGGDSSGKLVIEAKNISKAYADIRVVENFSAVIQRGDRIGLIGPNGIGKTTLLRLLLQQLSPDSGSVRHGSNIEIAYFDQHREQLDETVTVQENVAAGSDTVLVNGRQVHVISYLQNFLFEPAKVRGPITALSGGERNRLLLARLFTRPFNLLIMDEPTNDLDLETLEVLEDLLMEYDGTLLLVSHDRTFMDNVVTNTLVFEGEGRIQAYAGGYQDWLVQRPKITENLITKAKQAKTDKLKSTTREGKLSYKEQRELAQLPERIEALEEQLEVQHKQINEPGFYQQNSDAIKATMDQLQELQQQLDSAYTRWEVLDKV